MGIFRDFQAAARRQGTPGTTAIVVAILAGFALFWFQPGNLTLIEKLAFSAHNTASAPWTFLTYPFVERNPVSVLFACLWIWGIGGSVERDLGTIKYLSAFFVFTALSAVCMLLGALILNQPGVFLSGAWVPISAVTVMWGTRNPNQPLTLMFVLPVTGKWLAWLSAGFVFFATTPQLAPFAAVPLILAYAFAANKLPVVTYSSYGLRDDYNSAKVSRNRERQDKAFYDDVRKREKEREERDRLKKLFEGSIKDSEDS